MYSEEFYLLLLSYPNFKYEFMEIKDCVEHKAFMQQVNSVNLI